MEPAIPITLDELLDHSGWMRELARQLVRDAAAADDVVQEAFLAALKHLRSGEQADRGWLARVVYSQAALLGRGDRHRREREERSARAEALPSSAELASRGELQRQLVEAVLELRDPYRSVLLLRYYEDLLPQEIARRQGVPSATIRSQITRGTAQVRESLDARHRGDRRAWSLALVPLAAEREVVVVGAGVSSTLIAGLIAMPLSLKVIVSCLVALALWLAYLMSEPGAADPSVATLTSVHLSTSQAPTMWAEVRTEVVDEPSGLPATTEVAATELAKERDLDERAWTTFTVENQRGEPVADARITVTGLAYETPDEFTVMPGVYYATGNTDLEGKCRVPYPRWATPEHQTDYLLFTAVHSSYATQNEVNGRRAQPGIRVVLRNGTVFIVAGRIAEDATEVTDVRVHFSSDFEVKPEDWQRLRNGRLETTRVPVGRHLVYLEYESAEYGLRFSDWTEFQMEAGEIWERTLELKPARRLVGRLASEVPRPVVDGHVALAVQMTAGVHLHANLFRKFDALVNSDGSFVIDGLPDADGQIIAWCRGWASKQFDLAGKWPHLFGDVDISDDYWTHQVVMRADGEKIVAMEPTATLEVMLRTSQGSPLSGADVQIYPVVSWVLRAFPTSFVDAHDWSAVTDMNGAARIEDIPAGTHLLAAAHTEYEFPREPAQSGGVNHYELFRAGETEHKTYALELRRKD